MKTMNKIAGVILLACLLILGSCKKEQQIPFGGSMRVLMTADAPIGYKSPYTRINVEVTGVAVAYTEPLNPGSPGIPSNKMGPITKWIDLDTKAGVYDFLELQNNINVELAKKAHFLPGEITQIRILFGTHNSVRLNEGLNVDMVISPEDRAGVFINTPATIENHKDLFVLLGLNISSSVINNGGQYVLKPVIEVKATGYGSYPIVNPPVFHGPNESNPN